MPSSGPQESKCPGWLRPDASLPNVILPKRTLGRGANIFCRTEVEQQLQEALRVQNVPMHGKAPCVSPLASKAPSHSCSTGPGLLSSCPYSWGNPSSQRFYSVAASTLKDLAASPHMQWPTWFLAQAPTQPPPTAPVLPRLKDHSFKVRVEGALLSHLGNLALSQYGMY